MNSLHRLRNAFEDAEIVLQRNRAAIVEQLAHDTDNATLLAALAAIDAALAQLGDQKRAAFCSGFL